MFRLFYVLFSLFSVTNLLALITAAEGPGPDKHRLQTLQRRKLIKSVKPRRTAVNQAAEDGLPTLDNGQTMDPLFFHSITLK